MNPLVSVIVPCYNQAQYLDECLQSIIDQTYQDWECIIINDGSPDNTEEVANKWIGKDSRFKYLYKENGGLSSARNLGISIADGEFILPLDADDKIAPDYLHLSVQSFQEDSSLKVVYCKAEKFGEEQGLWELPIFSHVGLVRQNMIFCSALYKREDWIAVKGYDENLIYGLEDWEFWIAILRTGGDVKCLDYIGFLYRIKKMSMIKSISNVQRSFSENYIYNKHLDFVFANYDAVVESNRNLLKRIKKVESDFKREKILINALLYKVFGINILAIKQKFLMKYFQSKIKAPLK